ncbi:MAG: hypothetical protein A2Z88_09550 [Omnitrophica WOR_2 bacterium GWA2_47_8]|nr:MAG: hypothetical protein A2Z88_09550 [Omnitrophica WOR_2 bacterium GWA2_47_8]
MAQSYNKFFPEKLWRQSCGVKGESTLTKHGWPKATILSLEKLWADTDYLIVYWNISMAQKVPDSLLKF